ncbi:MAG TPA: zf-HC2 domain-containing protein [Pyrinomonadaceae bacterium]|jgi:hypothetical protein
MSEHFSTRQVELYLERRLTPSELLAADDHLAACGACREKLVRARKPEALVASVRASLNAEAGKGAKHLDYEQLAAYVDDEVDDVEREIVDSHLSFCGQCGEEMRDLFAFKETLNRSPQVESTARAAPGFLERFLSHVRSSFLIRPVGLAGGLAALTLVALGITMWLVWKSSSNRPVPAEMAKTQPSPAMAETQSSPAPAPTASQPQEKQQKVEPVSPAATPQRLSPPSNREQGTVSPVPKEEVVVLNDGGRKLMLDNQGRIQGLDGLSPLEQQSIRTALLKGDVETSSELAGLGARNDAALMGAPGSKTSFGLLSPVGAVVRTDTPTFRWNALEGATEYTVKIFDSGFNRVMTSGALSKTEWTAPRALARGSVYRWQVTALVEGKEIQAPLPPAPEARFRVLGRAQEESLRRAEKLYARSHLVLGVFYSRAGLLDEAEREFRALLAANPNSQIARKLLLNIQMLKEKR